ncbi:50S ribosomal protein L18 [Candidatus Woesearchaeota archaeon]|nr:50S ribosomal protein L18 [Candidatus Woesearchaeota archaeon]
MRNITKVVPHRRKREGKTDYKQRLKQLLGSKPRLVARKSLKNIRAQIIVYKPQGDVVQVAADSNELNKYGWSGSKNNIPAAYLVGLLLGKKAKAKNINDAIFDIGLNISTKGSKLYALLKGALDAGMDIPHSKDNLPTEERILGKHIELYNKTPVTALGKKVKENILKGTYYGKKTRTS